MMSNFGMSNLSSHKKNEKSHILDLSLAYRSPFLLIMLQLCYLLKEVKPLRKIGRQEHKKKMRENKAYNSLKLKILF